MRGSALKAFLAPFGLGAALLLLISVACGGGSSGSPTAPGGSTDVFGSGVVAQKSVAVSGFSSVDHSAVGTLVIEHGAVESLVITAEDNILPYVQASVLGGRLKLSIQSGVSLHTTRKIEYLLTVVDIDSVELNGVGDIRCDQLTANRLSLTTTGVGNLDFDNLDVATLNVDLFGVGSIRASGSATSQKVVTEGLDDYHGGELQSETAEVEVSGIGSVTVRVSKSLTAKVTGSGCVYYIGSPTVEAQITGSGCVEQVSG